jgi:hypothetical protein
LGSLMSERGVILDGYSHALEWRGYEGVVSILRGPRRGLVEVARRRCLWIARDSRVPEGIASWEIPEIYYLVIGVVGFFVASFTCGGGSQKLHSARKELNEFKDSRPRGELQPRFSKVYRTPACDVITHGHQADFSATLALTGVHRQLEGDVGVWDNHGPHCTYRANRPPRVVGCGTDRR